MPSRTAILPGKRVKPALISEKFTPLLAPPGAPDKTRSSAGSPRTMKLRMVMRADLRRLLLRRRVHRHPHFAAEHARISVGETEQRAGVIGFEKQNLMIVARAQAKIAVERRVTADLGIHREGADMAAAARQFQLQTAQRFAVMSRDRADLDVEIEVGLLLAWSFPACPASDDLTKLRPS